MDFKNLSIGTDIEEIERFENKTLEKDLQFLNRIFTEKELDYCFSQGVTAQHLCARYCAKEAVVKALSGLNIKDVYYSDIEITNNTDGAPLARIEKYPEIEIKISLSHSKKYSTATALVYKK